MLRVVASRFGGNMSRLAAAMPSRGVATQTNDEKMFCFQCEQTESGTGCTTVGVCGKTPETAGLQDVLLHTLKGHAEVAEAAKAAGVLDENSDRLMLDCVFSTLTNVNFDPVRIKAYLDEVVQSRERLRAQLPADAANKLSSRTSFVPTGEEEQTRAVGVRAKQATLGEDTAGLQELIMYGIKGLAAYAHHAMTLGAESDEVYDFVRSTLSRLDTTTETGDLLGLALETGKANGTVLGLLDSAHRNHFGSPSPAEASLVPKVGPCILVSGHDMGNLRDLLKQAESKGVNVYTHGEMLPAHGYPKLRESPSLAGHYGGPWQLQKFEFAKFPGPILMTTNCIQEPRTSYKARIFTAGPTGWPGVSHIEGNDYSAVIDAALASPGFTAESSAAEASRAKAKTLLTGFGHEAVLGVAETVIGAIDSGALKHIYLVGGCDGAEPERAYFSELAREIKDQPDSLLLTLGCAKYRFNKMDFGTLGGLPRLLDMGQCNDSFSAVQVATTLASHYKCSVNDLPLSISLSWLEQKAVACLLTLLSLNVQNIRLGPALPAFVTPNVLNVLVDKFKLTPIRNDNATGDLKQMFAEKHQA